MLRSNSPQDNHMLRFNSPQEIKQREMAAVVTTAREKRKEEKPPLEMEKPALVPTRTGSLYLGSCKHVLRSNFLQKKKIDLCITVLGRRVDPKLPTMLQVRCGWNKTEHQYFSLEDNENELIDFFSSKSIHAIHALLSEGKNVFVHCRKGISRSVTICAAYLILYENKSRDDTLVAIRETHKGAKPNRGFMDQLLVLEGQCKDMNLHRQMTLSESSTTGLGLLEEDDEENEEGLDSPPNGGDFCYDMMLEGVSVVLNVSVCPHTHDFRCAR
eukprot:GHVO01013211.1.p1 GENE.GHVO01013211.1~~GHVO01013211.1.p1  ORF type:complete len:271 (+),score=40.29 GHVO01013211.1:57-869(+)